MAKVPVQENVERTRGNFISSVPGATVRIVARDASVSSPATHYADSAGTGSSTADLTADSSGVVSTFLTQGSYDIYFKARSTDDWTGPKPLEAVDTDNLSGGAANITFDDEVSFDISTPATGWNDCGSLTVDPPAGDYIISYGAVIAGTFASGEKLSLGLTLDGSGGDAEAGTGVQIAAPHASSSYTLQGVVQLTVAGPDVLQVVFGWENTGDLKLVGRVWIQTVEV